MNKDVNIVGEKAQSYRTTILGGFSTITGTQRVRSTIRGIDFEGPIWDAIVIGASTGSVIADNVIRNVVPVKIQVPSGRIITFAEGIGFSG